MANNIEIQRDFRETILTHLTDQGVSGLITARWTWRQADPFAIEIVFGVGEDGEPLEYSSTWQFSADRFREALRLPGTSVGGGQFTTLIEDDEFLVTVAGVDRFGRAHLSSASFPLAEVLDFMDNVAMLDDSADLQVEAAIDRLLATILPTSSDEAA